MSLNVVIATIGRESLMDMLESIAPQLDENDFVTLLCDGYKANYVSRAIVDNFKDRIPHRFQFDIRHTNDKLGDWGHGIRNLHQGNLQGDFICNADDDDTYTETGLLEMKARMYPGDLYLFRFLKYTNNTIHKYWSNTNTFRNNVGTPCGVYPNDPSIFPKWGLFYGGDGEFYEKLSGKLNVHWVDKVIYNAK